MQLLGGYSTGLSNKRMNPAAGAPPSGYCGEQSAPAAAQSHGVRLR